jgi:nucleoside-diphosphate-sugar epimerase
MIKLIFGCGYLGERVGRRWLDAGHTVWVTTRHAESVPRLEQLGFRPVVCDILNPHTLHDFPDADGVLYAIAPDRRAGDDPRQVYVNGLSNVLARLRSGTCRRFVYVSSTSVYGQRDGSWVDENSPTEPGLDSGRMILQAEEQLWARPDLRPVILRFGGIYGPGRMIRVEGLARGEPITGEPDRWLNLIHVEDGVAAVLAAEDRGTPGEIYNVCDGTPVLRRGFYGYLTELLHAPEPRFVVGVDDQRTNRRVRNRRMLDELGVQLAYPSFREGLAEICRESAVVRKS